MLRKAASFILIVLAVFLLGKRSFSNPIENAKTLKPGKEDQEIDELKRSAPKVFIDGSGIDINYIRTEITFVNYVRDRQEADVHVLITQQQTGSGGQEYTLLFIGLNGYTDLKNELKFYSNGTEADDEVRKGMVQILKLGLAPYAARTPISRILTLNTDVLLKPNAVVDKWDSWVFSLSTRGLLYGEQSAKTNSLNGNFAINRVTPESRLRMGFSASLDTSNFDYGDYTESSSSESKSFDGLYVKSLGDHWSVGAFVNAGYSTYSNIDLGMSFAPTMEYDFFPYADYSRRQLCVLYRLGFNYSKYIEETIYDKMSDRTFSEALTVSLSFTQPWGNSEISVEGSHYFQDLSLNRVMLWASLSLHVWKGLALTVDGRYAAVHDQLGLRKSEASIDDLLLRRTELATDYSYFLALGFSYSFGSVYSNVVNPRFGGRFGGPGSYYY